MQCFDYFKLSKKKQIINNITHQMLINMCFLPISRYHPQISYKLDKNK